MNTCSARILLNNICSWNKWHFVSIQVSGELQVGERIWALEQTQWI